MKQSASIAHRNLVALCACLGVAVTGAATIAQSTKPPPPTKPGAIPVKPGAQPVPITGDAALSNTMPVGQQKNVDPAEVFVSQRVESAQGMGFWMQHSGAQMDLHIELDGKPPVDATMILDIKKNRARIERKDGVTLVYDGEHAWVSPANANVNDARFELLNWPFFFGAPFRMTEPKASVSEFKVIIMKGVSNDTVVLKHDLGSWASPDDWYRIYVNHETQYLGAIAYQVTPAANASEADKQAHAVMFGDYAEVDSMHLAMSWTFWNWNPDWGIRGDSIGSIKLTNVKFMEPTDDKFAKPANSREEKAPPAKVADAKPSAPATPKPVTTPSSETDKQ